jgi:hypothetical protein
MKCQGKRLGLALWMAAGLWAQEPSHPWNGRAGRALLDMPADDSGVDLPLDQAVLRERLEKYGVGVAKGASVTVTLVKRKGDHIEVHLNGGGFTNRELFGLPGFDSSRWGITDEEQRARRDMIGTRDPKRRKTYERRYNSLRTRRVTPLRKAYEMEQRAKRGSRFNVRLQSGDEAGLEQALAPYVAFPP